MATRLYASAIKLAFTSLLSSRLFGLIFVNSLYAHNVIVLYVVSRVLPFASTF